MRVVYDKIFTYFKGGLIMENQNTFTYEEFKAIAKELYQKGKMSLEEYQICLTDDTPKNNFNGKLTPEQLQILKEKLVNEKEIRKIEEFLTKYKDHLSDYTDLVGDNLVPGKFFYFNMQHFGYLLDDDPKKVLSKQNIEFRKKYISPLIKTLGPKFLNSKQIFENRSELMKERDYRTGKALNADKTLPDQKIVLPNEPVIWTLNHHFKEDALGSVLACLRPVTILFGSIPQFYNTFDGSRLSCPIRPQKHSDLSGHGSKRSVFYCCSKAPFIVFGKIFHLDHNFPPPYAFSNNFWILSENYWI